MGTPKRLAVFITRHAISPLLAIKIFENNLPSFPIVFEYASGDEKRKAEQIPLARHLRYEQHRIRCVRSKHVPKDVIIMIYQYYVEL